MSTFQGTPQSLKILAFSQKAWFISLILAQVVFVAYLSLGYGITSFSGDLSEMNRFNNSAHVTGDSVGNSMYALHVLLAIIMILGGSLQLISGQRTHFKTFHRYNGRLFVLLACTISIAGMYLIFVRGTVGNAFMHTLTVFSGAVVLVSSTFAVLAARRRNIALHQIWAIRLFLAANGVLFFRLMIYAWFMVFGPLGVNTKDFTGPTVVVVTILSYVFPLLFAELIRHARKSKQPWLIYTTTSLLLLFTAIFLIGLFGITLGSWYPLVFK